ncbi:MAG: SGNH/GDSL hydrolase family protein [Verrucomicrobiales bacterium]|nr:SGNH/GDSL hydrolase family protein [Verrucomicrobiales bacterium]MCP5557492.1 SGNH/GDSL hydrolase family protein [Verrucomicrobiaceae bacterium]
MSTLTRPSFFVALVLLCWSAVAFADGGFQKVLFVGNSITLHGPKADIDWSGNWGMAASEESKDYVHLVTKALAAKSGVAPEALVKNIADFERAYVGYDLAEKLKEAIEFRPDLIILAIGENVPAVKSAEEGVKLQKSVTELLRVLVGDRHVTVLVRSCFWANAAKDDALRKACSAVGGIFVDISELSKDEGNFGRAERAFKHAGVANHPGDKGMAAIAAALVKALPQ